jgi:hypothetical protein
MVLGTLGVAISNQAHLNKKSWSHIATVTG